MSGKPEMSHNVQQYDKTQFLRVEEAHRCCVRSALFMPLYAAAARQHPFGVFEVVPADTHVPFPVLVQWLKSCLQVSINPSNKPYFHHSSHRPRCLHCLESFFNLQHTCIDYNSTHPSTQSTTRPAVGAANTYAAVQEVQLYTADATQVALTLGSRVHTMPPAFDSPKPPSISHGAAKKRPSASMTHCSASSFHEQRHSKGAKQGSPSSAAEGGMPVSPVHEVSADSEEQKTCSSRGGVSWSPDSSSALLAGSCGASFIKQERPEKLQSASGGDQWLTGLHHDLFVVGLTWLHCRLRLCWASCGSFCAPAPHQHVPPSAFALCLMHSAT